MTNIDKLCEKANKPLNEDNPINVVPANFTSYDKILYDLFNKNTLDDSAIGVLPVKDEDDNIFIIVGLGKRYYTHYVNTYAQHMKTVEHVLSKYGFKLSTLTINNSNNDERIRNTIKNSNKIYVFSSNNYKRSNNHIHTDLYKSKRDQVASLLTKSFALAGVDYKVIPTSKQVKTMFGSKEELYIMLLLPSNTRSDNAKQNIKNIDKTLKQYNYNSVMLFDKNFFDTLFNKNKNSVQTTYKVYKYAKA